MYGVLTSAEAAWNAFRGNSPYKPPAPTEIYGDLGASASGGFTASEGPASASGSAGAAVAISARRNLKTGAVTAGYEYEVTAEVAAKFGIAGTKAEVKASGTVKVALEVTTGPGGDPIEITAQGQAVGDASAQTTVLFGGSATGPSANGGAQFTASLKLTKSQASSIGADLLRSAGIPTSGTGAVKHGQSAYDALDIFLKAARDRGTLTRQDLATDSATAFEAQVSLKDIEAEFAAGLKNSTAGTKGSHAQYLINGIWKDWEECG